ncbi:MAG: 5'/3'-nucleotidase SurE [candidate division NC10 bacterium]|nr:5'/3'-nucleotidase SurE [candidate division NC10 bacterium]
MGREERPLILVSNDDGIGSAGLQALVESLRGLGEVVVVAPDRERSAAGHSLTLSRPLAVMGLLPRRPRLVAAGINHGSNMGDDVTYSGTVSSAIEATLQGIPAFAISVAGDGEADFQSAARFARRLAGEILRRGLPPDTLLNVNVPNLPPDAIQGVAVTRQGRRVYSETVIRKIDPRGKAYYWIGGTDPTWERPGGTDYEAVSSGWISLTPLHLDLTNHRAIDELKGWGLSLNGGPPA